MKSRSLIHWWRHEGDQRFASVQAGERERGGWEWERIKRWGWNEMMMMTNYNSYNRARTLTCFREKFTRIYCKEKWKYKIKKETKRRKKGKHLLLTFLGEHTWGAIKEICDIWDTDYNYDNWEIEFLTIFVTWQLRVTVDSIRNSCDVWNLTDVTLADEDSNSILTDKANRTIQRNVAMQA